MTTPHEIAQAIIAQTEHMLDEGASAQGVKDLELLWRTFGEATGGIT